MRYHGVTTAFFIDRPNRFAAHVELGGAPETVHVKNSGRCRELLVPGSRVILAPAQNPRRKTRYDLIGVYAENGALFNIDSQAPNKAVSEWLQKKDYSLIKPEYTFGRSRIDFYMERGKDRFLMEVKGCTLIRDSMGYFPDAPTERGVWHLRELANAVRRGFRSTIAFVIQTQGVSRVLPNTGTHPAFAEALYEAEAAGVEVLCLPCRVEPDLLEIAE